MCVRVRTGGLICFSLYPQTRAAGICTPTAWHAMGRDGRGGSAPRVRWRHVVNQGFKGLADDACGRRSDMEAYGTRMHTLQVCW